MYEECDVYSPHTDCHRYSDPISIPNGNASNLNEYLIWGDRSIAEVLGTYMRRTINREEAAVDKKEAT